MSEEHTPTPWNVDGDDVCGNKGKQEVCFVRPTATDGEDSANAEFIVRAVNSHAALLEAANKAKKMIDENFLQSVIARDTLASLNEAIAQAELRP